MSRGLYYTKEHEWLKVEGEYAYVGITDHAQEQLGDIVYLDFPDIDDEFGQFEAFSSVESVKTAADVNMPVSGTVVEINEDLNEEPEKLNDDAYEAWIIKIKISDEDEIEELMNDEEYEEFCKGE